MAGRFKVSKYKNAISYVYKKEQWIHDLKVGSNLKSNSTHIKSSCRYIAFIHDSTSSGSVAVLPIDSYGRNTNFPLISGHSGFVTDFDFSPFDDSLLATGAEDGIVKLWDIPEGGAQSCSCRASLGPVGTRIEAIHFHPTANNVLAFASGTNIHIWDLFNLQEKYVLPGHENAVQSFCWHGNGSLIGSICKEGKQKKIRVFDPRSGSVTAESSSHTQLKDSQIVWLGDSNYLVSTGFNISREAEIALWDITNMDKPLCKKSLGNAAGAVMPFYDEDTKMLYVGVKGESSVCFFEVLDKSPYLSPGPNSYRGTITQKGLCLAPKRSVDVMSCQVARLYLLTQNAIVPLGFNIQRKTYTDFHEDLFPDTAGPAPAMTAQEWFDGGNKQVVKVSMKPSSRSTVATTSADKKGVSGNTSGGAQSTPPSSASSSNQTKATQAQRATAAPTTTTTTTTTDTASPTPAQAKALKIVRSSKVRYVEGKMLPKNTYIEKVPKLSSTVPGDSDAFHANSERCAVCLDIPGGQIGVFELKPSRLDGDSVPTLQNGAGIMDFCFDPFNNKRLLAACDDASIKVWDVPEGGLTETLTKPTFSLLGHYEKPNVLKYHPQASDILASAGYDLKIFIWNLASRSVAITLDPLQELVMAMEWSPSGQLLATLCKDRKIRIYEPRASSKHVKEGVGPEGSRGARIVWIDEDHLLISGFNKSSCRELLLYSMNDLRQAKGTLALDVSPTTLIPHCDPDVHLVYLTGKGDNRILTVEYVLNEPPFLFQTATFQAGSLHQAVSFLPKTLCDVKAVEIARAVRLTQNSVEPLTFRIPRVKTEYFQDDLYCDTLVHWEAALTAEDWLAGKDAIQRRISLRPEGMKLLSEAPKAAPVASKYQSYQKVQTDEEKKEELLAAMITKMGDKDEEKLPQDDMEGVDSDEWDDY